MATSRVDPRLRELLISRGKYAELAQLEQSSKPFPMVKTFLQEFSRNQIATKDSINKFGREALQATPRALMSPALDVVNNTAGLIRGQRVNPQQTYTPGNPVSKFLLGTEPIMPVAGRIERGAQTTTSLTGAQGFTPYAVGALGVGASTLLDTVQTGGSSAAKVATKSLVKEIEKRTGKKIAAELAQKIANDMTEATIRNRGGALQAAVRGVREAHLPQLVDPVARAKQYVVEQVAARKAAAEVGKIKGVIPRVVEGYKRLKRGLVESLAPVEDPLNRLKKQYGFEVPADKSFTNAVDRSLKYGDLAGQFVKDRGYADLLQEFPDKGARDELAEYLLAKQNQYLEARGIQKGRTAVADTNLITSLGPRYEDAAKRVIKYGQDLLDESVKKNLISPEFAAHLKSIYPEYVPTNVIFDEIERASASGAVGGSKKALASVAKQTVVQKSTGSLRAQKDPLEELLKKTADVFQQGEKNMAALAAADEVKNLSRIPGNPLGFEVLRDAANVKKRGSLFQQSAELRPLQDKVGGLITKYSKALRSLQTELRGLEKKGLHIALKPGGEAPPSQLTSQLQTIRKPGSVQFGQADEVVGGTLGKTTFETLPAVTTARGEQSTKSFIDALITDPNADLKSIKNKIATRENKLGPLIDEIENMRGEYDEIHQTRQSLTAEALDLLDKDAKEQGLNTWTALRGGVKEIYGVKDQAFADALKNLNAQQIGVIGRFAAPASRTLRLGTTGLRVAFAAGNLARDQVMAAINAKSLSSFIKASPAAWWAAIGHGELYQQMVRAAGGGTSFDIGRSQLTPTLERIVAGKNVMTNTKYVVTHPSTWLRSVENLISRTEEVTRAQVFKAAKEDALKRGMKMPQALAEAAMESRNVTANFARGGEWMPAVNALVPYLRAGINGVRGTVRSFARNPGKSSAKVGVLLMMPMASLTAWNLSDPKRKAAYEDISIFEKDNNFIFIPPNPTQDEEGKWNVVKVPIPQGVGNLTRPLRRSIEQASGLDPVKWQEVASALIGSVSPIEPTIGSVSSTLVPQIIKPTVESNANKTFFTGREIVPRDLITKNSPREQYNDNTSGTARLLSKTNLPGLRSPMKTEAWIKATLGGSGAGFLNTTDKVLATVGAIPKDQIGGKSLTQDLQSKFSKAYGGQISQQESSSKTEVSRAVADRNLNAKRATQDVAKKWVKAKTAEEKNKIVTDAIRSGTLNKGSLQTFKDVLTPRRFGSLSTSDPIEVRALVISKKLKTIKDSKEKSQYLVDLRTHGILTDETLKYLTVLMAKK